MKYAHYISTTKRKTVYISSDIQGRDVLAYTNVNGKKEARKFAAIHNATPWNF